MFHFVVCDTGWTTVADELELGPQWRAHDSLDAFLAVTRGCPEPTRLLLCTGQTRSLELEQLRQLHADIPLLRVLIATPRLAAGEERRLLLAGACAVLQSPWPTQLWDRFEDRAYLSALFPGKLPESSRERHEFELPSQPEHCAPLIRAIVERVEARGAATAVVRSLLPMVLDELLANAMEHGNHWQIDKRVRVEFELDGSQLSLRVGDEGSGFDRARVPNPTLRERLYEPRGRGLYLVERCVDEVCYEDNGATIRVRMSLQPQLQPA